MKRKLLSILLSLVMVLSLLPTAALADSTNTSLPAANAEGVITLTGNITTTGKELNGAINNGAEINLDNYTLTLSDNQSVTVPDGKTLKIYGGKIEANKFAAGTYSVFSAGTNATIIMKNVTMETTGSALFPAGNASAVTVTDSKITAGVYAVGTNASGTSSNNVAITLTDSEFTAQGYSKPVNGEWDGDDCAVMINVPGTLSIKNCKITGNRQALFVRCGTATVTDSTITLAKP